MKRTLHSTVFLFLLLGIFAKSHIFAQSPGILELNASLKSAHSTLSQGSDIDPKIAYLKSEIEQAISPQKQVFQSMLAEIYYTYLIENLEALKTQPIIAEDSLNISSWSGQRLIEKARNLYLHSLDSAKELQVIKSQEIDFPKKGSVDDIFRPSLYDVLAHRALDFFTDPRAIRNPAPAAFRMQAQSLILAPETFTEILFPILDTLNHTKISLDIYQDLLAYQLEEESYEALLDTDLRLIKWLRSYASGLDKAGKYIRTLRDLIETYPDNEALADVQYELALVYVSIAGDFQPLAGNSYKWDYRRALEICINSIESYPNSRGAKKCAALIELIQKSALRIAAEESNLPDQPFRIQVTYRNLKHLYYRLYRIPFEQESVFKDLKAARVRWDFAQEFPLAKSGDTYLANDGDLQFHRTETAIPALPPGTYALCASNSKSFDWSADLIAVLPIKITRLSTYTQNTEDSVLFYLRDRANGQKLADVPVSFTRQGKLTETSTDSEGRLAFERVKSLSTRFFLHLNLAQDSLTETLNIPPLASTFYRAKTKAYVFTESPSYLRGGFISIKGIVRKNLEDDLSPIPDTSLTLYISQEGNYIDTLYTRAQSNGVFEYTYPLPLHIQAGTLYVLCGAAYARIEVVEKQSENYELYLEQNREQYLPADSVLIFGKILGPPDTDWEDADVKYLVTRDVRFPDWADYSWWKPLPHNREVLVKQGKSLIDSTGHFQVPFQARPDPSHPSSQRPVYFYKIRVLATDPEGERLLKTYNLLINESGKALALKAPSEIHRGDKLALELKTKNLRGKQIPFEGKLIIESLVAPARIYRKRRWLIPDLHLVSEEEYRKDFPTDVYGYEDDFRSWALKDTVFQDSIFAKNGASQLSLDTKTWEAGMYRVRMILPYTDEKTIQKRHYFRISETKEALSAIPEFFSFDVNKKIFRAGDTLLISLKSSLSSLPLYYQVNKGRNTLEAKWVETSQNKGLIRIPIQAKHQGTVSLFFSYVYENEPVRVGQDISVKSSAPDFEIVEKSNSEIHLSFEEETKGDLLTFHSQVSADMPKLETFYFGLQRAGKPIEQDKSIRYPEPARAALASGAIWETPIELPLYEYSSLSLIGETANIEEQKYFGQLAGEVLLFPSNRRSIPPKHRWINLLANVKAKPIGTPAWALHRLKKQLSWQTQQSFYAQTIQDQQMVPLNFPLPQIPGTYRTMTLLMDDQGSFSFRRKQHTFSPTHVLLPEYNAFLEANTSNAFPFRILNTTDDSLLLNIKIQLGGLEYFGKSTLGPNMHSSLRPTFPIPDLEGVYKLRAEMNSPSDTRISTSPVFVRKRNYVFGRMHMEMEAKARKKVLPRRSVSEVIFKAHRSPSYYAVRALPSLIAQVNPQDAFSIQQALFALSVIEDFWNKDPAFEAWYTENYEGYLDLLYLEELRLHLQKNLRDLQLSNGAFAEKERKSANISLTSSILQVEKDLQELGLESSVYQQQSLAFSLHYLDSLYLHPAPQSIIWRTELGKYVELRNSLSNYAMEKTWLASWNALNQLHDQEKFPTPKPEETRWIIANLLTEFPNPNWQASIMKLLKPDWERLQREGVTYFEVNDFSITHKKKRIILKKKRKEKIYVEKYKN